MIISRGSSIAMFSLFKLSAVPSPIEYHRGGSEINRVGADRQAYCYEKLIGESIAGAACIDWDRGFSWLMLVGRVADMVAVSQKN
jgi:hypothetical protein